jgi:hypothetical protein
MRGIDDGGSRITVLRCLTTYIIIYYSAFKAETRGVKLCALVDFPYSVTTVTIVTD